MLNYAHVRTSKMTDGTISPRLCPLEKGPVLVRKGNQKVESTTLPSRQNVNTPLTTDILAQNSPFWLFITGDLVFYAIMAGKEAGDKYWCHWCQLGKHEWQIWPYTNTTPTCWTIEELALKGQEYDGKK
jgi:hypothetical protein